MTNAVATTNGAGLSSATLEGVVVGGDLSKLDPAQRLEWYRNRCAAAGLDPRTQPFQYLTLQGKLSLYATKAATDQLIANRSLSVQIVNRGAVGDLYEVICRVTFADGHHVEDMAALPIAGLRGEALANAVMKCVTKAKRRTVLSACGLGMLDESETETIPGARHVDMQTGEVLEGQVVQPQRQIEAPKFQPGDHGSPEWATASKYLRAQANEAGKGLGLSSKEIALCLSDSLKNGFGLASSTEASADQLRAIADRIKAHPSSMIPPLPASEPGDVDDDIPPFDKAEAAT